MRTTHSVKIGICPVQTMYSATYCNSLDEQQERWNSQASKQDTSWCHVSSHTDMTLADIQQQRCSSERGTHTGCTLHVHVHCCQLSAHQPSACMLQVRNFPPERYIVPVNVEAHLLLKQQRQVLTQHHYSLCIRANTRKNTGHSSSSSSSRVHNSKPRPGKQVLQLHSSALGGT
jgi:hypothetical protein